MYEEHAAPITPVFPKEDFGPDLALQLDVLYAVYAHTQSHNFPLLPHLGLFTRPVGSFFEADMITRHYYSFDTGDILVCLRNNTIIGAREALGWRSDWEKPTLAVLVTRIRVELMKLVDSPLPVQ
jgi:hypothetical protein